MIENLKGKLYFAAFVLLFLGWSLLSIHHEEKMNMRLEQSQCDLEQVSQEKKTAISTMENAIRGKEQVHVETSRKKKDLETSLNAVTDWSGIAIPDNVIWMLQNNAGEANGFCPSGNTSGRCENPSESEDQDGRGHGAPDSGR